MSPRGRFRMSLDNLDSMRVSEIPGQDFGKSRTTDFRKSETAISLNRGHECGSDFGSAVRAVPLLRVILGRGNAETEGKRHGRQ
jgi:hypothetical protein